MADQAHILVVDDEPDVRDTIGEFLGMHGFAVATAGGGADLRAALTQHPVDLVVLDVNMPGEDGLTLTRYLRAHGDVGIVILTGAGSTLDRIVGLEIGADDYLAKPFDPRELLARIRSVLRRLRAPPAAPASAPPNAIHFGRFRLDLDAQRLFSDDGGDLALSAMEFDLLAAFARHPNQVLSRDRLLSLARRRDGEPFDRSIDVRVARIRRKIEADPAKPQFIRTLRSAGYIFVPDDSQPD